MRLASLATQRTTASSSLVAAWLPMQQQFRSMNVNPSLQRRQTEEFYGAQRFTDFDVDREKWGKQTQWHTMDCILDPTIEVPSYYSIKGLRKHFSLWLTMKKVHERRPGFAPEVELKQTYIDYKRVAFTNDPNQLKQLCRHTTWTESLRIEADTKKTQLDMELKEAEKTGGKAKSWKDLSVKQQSIKNTRTAATPPPPPPPTPTAASSSAKDNGTEAPKASAAPDDEEKLDVKTPLMEIKIDKFEITNVYIGQMTSDDWVQITARVIGKYRTPKTAPMFDTLVEYPVFELKMGDGINNTNGAPFTVVAVMDRDGARYGKDGNDAPALRKSLSQTKKSWFSG